ncbi:MAG: T9SS type A sorting domain-containing protein, partial [Chitinophagaceae bacterium]
GMDEGRSIAVQSDGKVVVAGRSDNGIDFGVVRYNTDGTLDNTFDGDGIVVTSISPSNDVASGVAIQSDGKIVVAGYSLVGTTFDFALVRYNTDGSLDNTFDGDGIVTTPIGSGDDIGRSLVIQGDGKIVVAGYTFNGTNNDFAAARYNTDGTLDNTFDTDGKVSDAIGAGNDEARSVIIQTDGKLVLAGRSNNGTNDDFALIRYNINGSLDNTFDTDGKVTTAVGTGNDVINDIARQGDGKLVVAGRSLVSGIDHVVLGRYNTNGSPDNTFDGDGFVITPIGATDDNARAVVLQNDAKIIAAGFSFNGTDNDFALARYNPNGTLDNTFDGDGKVTTDFASSDDSGFDIVLAGLRIYVAGFSNTDFAVAAYLNDAFPLPLSLALFTASKNNGSIDLSWKTASERNTAYFVVERSADGRSFANVGTVQASGNSSLVKSYSFTDKQPLTGTGFYRLKMFDQDGSFVYSKIVAINMSAFRRALQIFPNPVRDLLQVQATGNETITVQIVDAAGKIAKQERVQLNGNTSFSVEVQSLPKGKYYLVLQKKDGKETEGFVKQ